MIGFWLFIASTISLFCFIMFLMFALDNPDKEDKRQAKLFLGCSFLSWLWPVALPALIIFLTVKGIRNVFESEDSF